MVTRPEALILVPSFELGRQICAVADMLTQDLPDAPEALLLSNGNRFGPEKRALQTGAPRLIVATPARLVPPRRGQPYSAKSDRSPSTRSMPSCALQMEIGGRRSSSCCTSCERWCPAQKAPHSKRQYILAAATVSEEHAAQISEQLGALPRRVSHRGILVPTLRQQFHFVRGDKEQELLRLLEGATRRSGCATGQRWSFVADHAVRNAYSIFCRKRDCQLMKQHYSMETTCQVNVR